MKENKIPLSIPNFPEEAEFPAELTEKYELLECLSEKADTQTFLAAEKQSGDCYVVKCYLRQHPLFEREEPEALKTLCAEPLPRFVAELRNDNMRCVLREYIPGDTLSALAERQDFSEDDVLRIGIQLCEQLQTLHSTQPPIIHRDIKPQNVIIRPDSTAVLIDFGISRIHTENETDTVAFGTQGFSPPEQYGFSQTDSRSDIYSLGVLLYWLLHRKTKIPKAGDTALEKVIIRCAQFDPNQRYTGIDQVKRALLQAKPAARKRRAIAVAVGALLLLVLTVLGICAAGRSKNAPITFSQPLIEQAVRMNLGLTEEETMTEELLNQVTAVYIVADQAYPDPDFFYPAINQWYADGKPVRGELTTLEDLTMLPNLEQVCIVAQELEDISALSELKKLNKVEFKHNYIADISVLAGMDRLTSVGINDNPVRDISPLAQCPNLAFLDLCDVRSYDPSVLAQLGNFDFLDISNPTESYRWLDGKSVLDLRIAWTGMDDLHVLDGVTRLERLEIDHTAVTELSPLAVHKGLKVLKLTGIPATDFAVLTELPQLEEVYIGEESGRAIETLGDVPFAVIYE